MLNGYQFVDIEGMASSIRAGSFRIKIDRNEETYNLLGVLAKFNTLGVKKWNYEGGQRDKRFVFNISSACPVF